MDPIANSAPLWVFAYGSLLWDAGFDPVETQGASLSGYARSFCMLSIHHRGTQEQPGLVLALDAQAGATCAGLALRVAASQTEPVLAMLRERELISSAYLERWLPVRLQDGRAVTALAYVIDPAHVQYCRHDAETQAQMIARATGGRGANRDYLYQTADRLLQLGVADPDLAALADRVKGLCDTG